MTFKSKNVCLALIGASAGVILLTCLALVIAQKRAAEPTHTRPRRVLPAQSNVIKLSPGANLQRALNAAQPGDTLVLEAGATYRGPVTLPVKSGEAYVTVTSSRAGELPEGVRVTPADAPKMAVIAAPGQAQNALKTSPGAHHYKFVGVEFRTGSPADFAYDLIVLGHERQTLAEVPHHLTFDRCLVRAFPDQELKRGIALNSAHTEIVNSHISGFKVKGQEAQAILGWNGPGPFKIVNNYLEGAGENVMFGGVDPSIPDLVPSDIEFRRNHLFKPLEWKGKYTVKNIFELKNARRVLVEGNILENNWVDAQAGWAVVFTPRNQGGAAPWSCVEEVDFRHNKVLNSPHAIQTLLSDNLQPSRPLSGLRLVNNVFDTPGHLLTMSGGVPAGFVVRRNTHTGAGNFLSTEGVPGRGAKILDNVSGGMYVHSPDQQVGRDTLAKYFPGADFRRNLLAGAPGHVYPPDNYYPASFAGVLNSDFRLASPASVPGTDGKGIGVDFDALGAALKTRP